VCSSVVEGKVYDLRLHWWGWDHGLWRGDRLRLLQRGENGMLPPGPAGPSLLLMSVRGGWRSSLTLYRVIAGACRGHDDSGNGCSGMSASRRRISPLRNMDFSDLGFSACRRGNGLGPPALDCILACIMQRFVQGLGGPTFLADVLEWAMLHSCIQR